MIIQDDKETLNSAREHASNILFNHGHNLGAYNELVQNKYSENISSESPMVETQFNRYYVPEKETNTTEQPPQKYYNNDNPIPYQSFRPKIIHEFEDLQVAETENSEPVDSCLEKVAEASVIVENRAAQNVEQITNPAVEPYLRLNSKGLIACVTFIAVTALIVMLIIINSVAIGAARGRIANLQSENAALTAKYEKALAEREAAFAEAGKQAEALTNLSPVEHITLPPVESYQLGTSNLDYSTNMFDQICKFLSKLFG